MSTLNDQWLEVFRAGDYGDKGFYTHDDLAQLAADYDPAKHEAPLVVGHPTDDAPAYGWVKALLAANGILFAQPHQVDPAFEQAVRDGRFKKRSIALRRDENGKLTLRHLGWLGAAVPHVKGMADAKFSADPFESFDFADNPNEETDMAEDTKKTFMEALKEFFSVSDGKPHIFARGDDKKLEELEQRLNAHFSEAIKAENEKRLAVEKELAAQKVTFGESSTKARIENIIARLKEDKRWLPAYNGMGVRAIFTALASSTVQEIEFAEDDKTVKLDPVEAFAKVLEGIGKIVPEGVAFNEGKQGAAKAPKLPENAGDVDQSSVEFSEMVNSRAKEKKIAYVDAYRELIAEGARPVAGTAAAGQV